MLYLNKKYGQGEDTAAVGDSKPENMLSASP
jgi:hypothetical protein